MYVSLIDSYFSHIKTSNNDQFKIPQIKRKVKRSTIASAKNRVHTDPQNLRSKKNRFRFRFSLLLFCFMYRCEKNYHHKNTEEKQ